MSEESTACCKVGAAIERYGLDDTVDDERFDDRLLRRWTGRGRSSPQGYRPLTRWFNQRLMKAEYDRRGLDASQLRLDREYDALVGDDEIRREELGNSLVDAGIDADRLESSFVSWSTMQRHLTGCLDASKPTEPSKTDWERNSVEVARTQLEDKLEEALGSLGSKGDVEGADRAEISVSIELGCPECPLRVPLSEALDRGYVCLEHLSDDDRINH